MSAIIICDGCGKEAKAEEHNGNFHKPSSWFQRSDDDGIQVACSRECIKKVSKDSGKTSVVLPGL